MLKAELPFLFMDHTNLSLSLESHASIDFDHLIVCPPSPMRNAN